MVKGFTIGEGIHHRYDDPKLAREILTKYTKEGDSEMLQKTYDFFTRKAGFSKELVPTDEGIQQILTFLGSTVLPSAKDTAPRQFYDMRVLDKLRK